MDVYDELVIIRPIGSSELEESIIQDCILIALDRAGLTWRWRRVRDVVFPFGSRRLPPDPELGDADVAEAVHRALEEGGLEVTRVTRTTLEDDADFPRARVVRRPLFG